MVDSLEEIFKYIRTSTDKDCLGLIKYLDRNLRCKSIYKKELLKIILLSNSNIIENILRTIDNMEKETFKSLKNGLECEGYTACILRTNQYEDMKNVLRKAFGKAYMYIDGSML